MVGLDTPRDLQRDPRVGFNALAAGAARAHPTNNAQPSYLRNLRHMTDPHSSADAAPPLSGHAPEDSSMGRRLKRHPVISGLVIVAVLLVIWLIVRALSKPKAKPAAQQPIPVAIAPVTVGNLDVYLDALGTVTPVYTVTVVSRVAGEITQIHFKEGQIVKTNGLLAVIDPRPYVAALIQAQGQLARDQALLKNARIDLVRYQNAYQDHAIPQQQLATQEATVDQDQATVRLDQGNRSEEHTSELQSPV